MRTWGFRNVLGLGLGLGLASCGGQPGVILDIGVWPEGATQLRVEGVLDGAPALAPLTFPAQTTRFVVYLPKSDGAALTLTLSAFDGNDCTRAAAQAEIALPRGLRRLTEASLPLDALTPPRCAAPQLEALTPAAGSTAGGTQLIVRGQNFLPGASLSIDGLAATDVVVSSRTQLRATLPRHLGAFGRVPVVLTNFDAQLARRADLFAYYASQFSFGTMTELATAQYTTGVLGADFNLDGRIDLASSNGQSSVSVMLGDGLGGFAAAKTTATGPNAVALAVGDFNTDSKPDLAVVTYGSNNVQILLGDGAGGFPIITDLPGVGIPGRVTVADIDGDGDEDLLVPSGYTNTVNVFLGNAKGGFTGPTAFPVGSSPGSVAVGDWNGDQKADLAVANAMSTNVSVLLGDGRGSFGEAKHYTTGGLSAFVATADLNGDRHLDLAVANVADNNVSLLFGIGNGEFMPAKNVGAGNYPYALAIADLDGDQQLDIAVACNGENKARVLLGDGAGNFGTAAILPTGDNPRTIAVGDWNGDNKPDLAVSNYYGHTVSVMLNQSQ